MENIQKWAQDSQLQLAMTIKKNLLTCKVLFTQHKESALTHSTMMLWDPQSKDNLKSSFFLMKLSLIKKRLLHLMLSTLHKINNNRRKINKRHLKQRKFHQHIRKIKWSISIIALLSRISITLLPKTKRKKLLDFLTLQNSLKSLKMKNQWSKPNRWQLIIGKLLQVKWKVRMEK
jgi:hypothetical protein